MPTLRCSTHLSLLNQELPVLVEHVLGAFQQETRDAVKLLVHCTQAHAHEEENSSRHSLYSVWLSLTSHQPTCCEVLLIGQVTSARVVGQQAAGGILQAGERPPGEWVSDGCMVHTDLLLKPKIYQVFINICIKCNVAFLHN